MRQISEIASDIRKDWADPSPVAESYLRAMFFLEKLGDSYRGESAEAILRYFLASAGKWRTPLAGRVKKEIRDLLASDARSKAARVVEKFLGKEKP